MCECVCARLCVRELTTWEKGGFCFTSACVRGKSSDLNEIAVPQGY